MNNNSIIIDNITKSDFENKQIRITKENKYLLPKEIIGKPVTHKLIFIFNKNEYTVNYTIGSKDGKSRSGVLKFNNELTFEILNIKYGNILNISSDIQNKFTIEKR